MALLLLTATVTPPPGTKVVGHVRETNGVRDPIRAAILLLEAVAALVLAVEFIGTIFSPATLSVGGSVFMAVLLARPKGLFAK